MNREVMEKHKYKLPKLHRVMMREKREQEAKDKAFFDCLCSEDEKSQCWEPCGELGHSDAHVKVSEEP